MCIAVPAEYQLTPPVCAAPSYPLLHPRPPTQHPQRHPQNSFPQINCPGLTADALIHPCDMPSLARLPPRPPSARLPATPPYPPPNPPQPSSDATHPRPPNSFSHFPFSGSRKNREGAQYCRPKPTLPFLSRRGCGVAREPPAAERNPRQTPPPNRPRTPNAFPSPRDTLRILWLLWVFGGARDRRKKVPTLTPPSMFLFPPPLLWRCRFRCRRWTRIRPRATRRTRVSTCAARSRCCCRGAVATGRAHREAGGGLFSLYPISF